VGVDVQVFEAGALGCAVEHELHGARAERGAALGGEDVIPGRVGVQAAHPSQGADFDAAEPVVAVQAILEPPEMQDALVEVDMFPTEPERLGKPEAVRKEHEEEGGVAEPPASLVSGINHPLDFFRGEVLAFARPAGRAGVVDFSLYASWGGCEHRRKGKCFPRS